MKKIFIIDYGYGNLFGLKKALAYAGADVVVSAYPADFSGAAALVLPGVGAFGEGISEFEKRGFKKAVLDAFFSGKPLLGICLGMQFLFDKSYEFGEHAGLGIISGEVKQLSVQPGTFCKIPHIGWNALWPPDGILYTLLSVTRRVRLTFWLTHVIAIVFFRQLFAKLIPLAYSFIRKRAGRSAYKY